MDKAVQPAHDIVVRCNAGNAIAQRKEKQCGMKRKSMRCTGYANSIGTFLEEGVRMYDKQ